MGKSRSRKKIPTPNIPNSKGKSLIVPPKKLENYDKIVFDFTYFQTRSISINEFNNFYKAKMEAINAVGDFFSTVKNINLYDKKNFFSPDIKKQLHYNELEEDIVINRIEKILIDGYNMPRKKVDQFERMYFEFAFNNGKRVIGTKINENIFSILFLDPNHLICEETCRNIKSKQLNSIPGTFEKWDTKILNKEETPQNELLKEIAKNYENGKYTSMEEIIEDVKYIIE